MKPFAGIRRIQAFGSSRCIPPRPIFSVRITRDYRALAIWNVDGDEDLVWFWIGSHSEYDRLLRQL